MNVVITHTDFRLYWPARINSLDSCLKRDGHTLHVIEIAEEGSPYYFADQIPKRLKSNWIYLFPNTRMETISNRKASAALWSKLEDLNPDVVLAGAIAYPSGATAVRWCNSRGKKIIIFDDARLQDVRRSKFVNYIKKRIYQNVDAVFAPAPSHAKTYMSWGVTKEKLFYGVNVVDNEWFYRMSEKYAMQKERLRSEISVPDRYFLGVGRLIKKKNWISILLSYKAIRQQKRTGTPSFVLIGEGPEKENILNTIHKENIPDVTILPFVSQHTLCKYYSLASALVLGSHYGESWGLVVNEAMACRLPVFVSRQCGCARTLVNPGVNGYLFDSDSRSELTQKFEEFISLPDVVKKEMGDQSRAIISLWSLGRFRRGAYDAINYCYNKPPSNPRLLDSIIMHCWRGRYRPA